MVKVQPRPRWCKARRATSTTSWSHLSPTMQSIWAAVTKMSACTCNRKVSKWSPRPDKGIMLREATIATNGKTTASEIRIKFRIARRQLFRRTKLTTTRIKIIIISRCYRWGIRPSWFRSIWKAQKALSLTMQIRGTKAMKNTHWVKISGCAINRLKS